MAPLNPSLLFAVGVALDLIYESLKRRYPVEEGTGFGVEWVGWAILSAGCWTRSIVYRRTTTPSIDLGVEEDAASGRPSQRSGDLWPALALSPCLVGMGFLWQSEPERYNWILPLVTTVVLLFFLARRLLHPGQGERCFLPLASPGKSGWALLLETLASLIISLISAWLICLWALPKLSWITAGSSILLLLQCLSYGALLRSKIEVPCEGKSTLQSRDELLQKVSICSFALWTLFLAMYQPKISLPFILILGTIRAFHYFILFTLCLRYSQSTIVSATTWPTVVVSVGQSLRADSSEVGLAAALVTLATLIQCILYLPSSAAGRKFLFLFLLLPGITIIQQHTAVISRVAGLSSAFARPDMHPIEKLAVEGQKQFSDLLASQSNTLKKAVAEYIRRYKRRPPPNFDKWFRIAEREEYVLLDEFDTMMETLEPFWGIPASELRSRVDAAFNDSRLMRFNIHNALVAYDHERGAPWMAEQVQSWLTPEWRLLLPNMTFAINVLDEPRVLAPHEILSTALHNIGMNKSFNGEFGTSEEQDGEVGFFKVDREAAWQTMASACSAESPARSDSSEKAQYRNLTFVTDPTDALDVCMHASLHKMHGFLSSPDSLDITHSLVPLFSQGKASIFNDILFPSPYYAGRMDQEDYVEKEDPVWSKKSNTLSWSGASTGGYATIENWQTLHRQHLLLSLQSPSSTITLLNETTPGQWTPYLASTAELQPLLSLKMIAAVQCSPPACSAQHAAFNITPFDPQSPLNPNRDPLNTTYLSKYTLDLDGNSFSGRYYRLLKSRSAVIKQTLFREWHDRHLVPWVHYIPLSMAGSELPEVMRFLARDPRGGKVGERIARQGRAWANITLRKVDLRLAFLRLLLEYGRLMDDEREGLGYGG